MIVRIIISNPTEWWKQLGSWLIRKVDKSIGSHVSVELETYSGSRVFESVFPRTKVSSFRKWSKYNNMIKVYEFGVPQSKQLDVIEYLEGSVGKPYSIPQLVLILLDYITPSEFKDVNGSSSLICSELGFGVLKVIFDLSLDETVDTIGVRDIITLCDRLEMRSE